MNTPSGWELQRECVIVDDHDVVPKYCGLLKHQIDIWTVDYALKILECSANYHMRDAVASGCRRALIYKAYNWSMYAWKLCGHGVIVICGADSRYYTGDVSVGDAIDMFVSGVDEK